MFARFRLRTAVNNIDFGRTPTYLNVVSHAIAGYPVNSRRRFFAGSLTRQLLNDDTTYFIHRRPYLFSPFSISIIISFPRFISQFSHGACASQRDRWYLKSFPGLCPIKPLISHKRTLYHRYRLDYPSTSRPQNSIREEVVPRDRKARRCWKRNGEVRLGPRWKKLRHHQRTFSG